jgi:large subunit ribosomal protein L33
VRRPEAVPGGFRPGAQREGLQAGPRSLPCSALPTRAAMAKPKKKKEIVFLVCEESGDRNYTLFKKPGAQKLELSKYSPRLRKHTKHVEKKK